MAGRQRAHRGGIAGLLQLIAEHQEAVEYDLIKLGLRLEWLGTEALTWRDLLVIVRQSPLGSAVVRAQDPDHVWGMQERLLAGILDQLRVLAWQNTKDGQEGRNPPTPTPRPGVQAPTNVFGAGKGMTPEEAEARLAKLNPLQHGG